MNKLAIILVGALLLASCGNQPVRRRSSYGRAATAAEKAQFNGIRKKVSILNFFNESPFGGKDLAVVATAELARQLDRTGYFIVDNQAFSSFGDSKRIYTGGGMQLFDLTRKGKMTGVNFVIYGRIIEARVREKKDEIGLVRKASAYSEAKIEVRIFDVNKRKEVFNQVLEGFGDDHSYRFFDTKQEDRIAYRQDLLRFAVKTALKRSLPRLVEMATRLDWTGRVAKIVGNKIYINAGRQSGIQLGDILKVITEGQPIYDPETGAQIGVTQGEVKGAVEIVDYAGPDISISVLHSGGVVVEGDYVQLY